MIDNHQFQKDVSDYFSQEPVPPEIHARLLETCQMIQDIPQAERRPPRRKRLAISVASAAAVFLLLCGTNAVSPAFAEGIPLIGRVFQLYNQNKTRVGSYVGTYHGVTQHHSQAITSGSQNLVLTLEESYCDGQYLHLTFSLEGMPSGLLKDLTYVSANITATVDGTRQESADLCLYPESSTLVGGASIPLDGKIAGGQILDVDYKITELTRYFQDGGSWDSLQGSFEGSAHITVDTSYNQKETISGESGDVQIKSVKLTPSYTVIDYTIPFWGFSSYTVDFPRLYLQDGTPIAYNLNESDVPSPEEIPRDAKTISGSACFDGLPNGTETIILRFLEKDLDSCIEDGSESPDTQVRVLAEVTIDLPSGQAVPSQTYLEEGMADASDYLTCQSKLFWMMPFDDPDMVALGQSSWKTVAAIPGLFQNGNSLWELRYDGTLTAEFVTDGPVPEKDLRVTVFDENRTVVAAGRLSHNTAVEMESGGDTYFSWNTELQLKNSYKPRLLDTLTVTLTDPATGEEVYQRSVRFTWMR